MAAVYRKMREMGGGMDYYIRHKMASSAATGATVASRKGFNPQTLLRGVPVVVRLEVRLYGGSGALKSRRLWCVPEIQQSSRRFSGGSRRC